MVVLFDALNKLFHKLVVGVPGFDVGSNGGNLRPPGVNNGGVIPGNFVG